MDEKSQLKYEVTDSPRGGMTNEAYQPDLVETGSQRPLYEKYLPEDKLTNNAASWYDNSFTRELHKPNRKGNQVGYPIKWRLELNNRQTRIHFERMQLAKRVHFRPVSAYITSGANNATTQQ